MATETPIPAVASDLFKRGMRHLAAADNVISTMADGKPHGMLATAVCSVCAEPPTLLVCINRETVMHGVVAQSGAMCISVLDERHAATAAKFLSLHGAERFSLCDWDSLETGAPAIRDALACFDTEIISTIDIGTHTIFFGRVIAMRCRDAGDPLIYHGRSYAGVVPLQLENVERG